MKSLMIIGLVVFSQMTFGQDHHSRYPIIALAQLRSTSYDTFRIQATVKSVYLCPPCPKGMICKPCEGNHVLIYTTDDQLEKVKLFTDGIDFPIEEKSCIFTVIWRQPNNRKGDLSLLHFVPAPNNKK